MKVILPICVLLLIGCITSPVNSDDCIRKVYVKYTVYHPTICPGWEHIVINGEQYYYYTTEVKTRRNTAYTYCDDLELYQHPVYVESCN